MEKAIKGANPEHVFLLDTTLRDGEQATGKLMPQEKVRIARMLESIGIDIIEAGFPVSSQGDSDAVALVAKEMRTATVCALARAIPKDILAAARALENAKHPRIHSFIATSDIHMEHKLRMTRDRVLTEIHNSITFARTFVDDVQFSMEDATRSDIKFLSEAAKVAITAGAKIINLPDTVGYSTPWSYAKMVRDLYEMVPELKNVVLSVHCHNDLGLAVANSLAGIREGARQAEGCFLGIGERAGNAAIEEIAMNIRLGREEFGNVITYFMPHEIGDVAKTVSESFGYTIPPNQPLVGSRVFTHSSGIHADGVNKNPETYEVIQPENVGWVGGAVELKSHMGRNGLSAYLDKMGYDGEKIVEEIYPEFTSLADVKRRITDEDLRMLVHEYMAQHEVERDTLFKIKDLDYRKGHASVLIERQEDEKIERLSSGNGAVDAVFSAITNAITFLDASFADVKLVDFQVVKGEGGSEANAWVVVRVKLGDKEAQGRSASPDTVVAAAKAFVYAINHLSL